MIHTPDATIVYLRNCKGYVPKCECGWVGLRVTVDGFTNLASARIAAYRAAVEHVEAQEQTVPFDYGDGIERPNWKPQ